VFHVQYAIAGQKELPMNPNFRCSALHVAESVVFAQFTI